MAKKKTTRKKGLKANGTLAKGHKYAKGGRIVKVTPKKKATKKKAKKKAKRKTSRKR